MYFLTFLALLIGTSVTSYALDSEYLPDPPLVQEVDETQIVMCMKDVQLPLPQCTFVSPDQFLDQIEKWRQENLIKYGIDEYGKERNFQGPEIVMGGLELPCDDACEQEKLENKSEVFIIASETVTSDRTLEELDRSEIRGHFFTPISFEHMKTFEGCLLIEFQEGAYLAICGDDDLERLENRIGYLRFLLKQRDLGGSSGGPTTREFYRISMRGTGHRGQLSEAHYQLGSLWD